MQYAFMSFSSPQASLADLLALARRFGYDAIEPRVGGGHKHGVEVTADAGDRAQVRADALASGVRLCCLATSCRFADPADAADNIELAHACIDLAADVGAPLLRVFGGALGKGLDRAAAVALVADGLRQIADHAAERGVTLALETHDDWCAPADVAAVMAAADHPSVGVNWDLMHPVRTGGATMEQAFATLGRWIRHVHVHDGSAATDRLEFLPIGRGVYDHRVALRLLTQLGYEGFLSGEWINWEPADVHLPRELAALRALEASFAP
ncbi:MAG: hypothetical protein BIFFINMI_03851 [Phycisphaerae bacterium]|nr:hypothetical protein [Phycisphaerae bacterium]